MTGNTSMDNSTNLTSTESTTPARYDVSLGRGASAAIKASVVAFLLLTVGIHLRQLIVIFKKKQWKKQSGMIFRPVMIVLKSIGNSELDYVIIIIWHKHIGCSHIKDNDKMFFVIFPGACLYKARWYLVWVVV